MTPAPPPSTDDNVDVNDVLNDPADSEALDPDSVDADFEQELEDLFSDDLDDASAAVENDEPIVLEDEPAEADDDLLQLEDEVDDDDGLIVLDDVVEEAAPAVAEDVESLVDDIAEESVPDLPEEEEVIELDDLVEETEDAEDEEIVVLDDLLKEDAEEPVADEAAEESVLEDVIEEDVEAEEISLQPEDMVDVALAEESAPEVPVDEAVAPDVIDDILDEPEAAMDDLPEFPDEETDIDVAMEEPAEEAAPMDSELTGLEDLDEEGLDDVDSLLDNVEVDVSDVEDAEEDEAEDIDIPDVEMEDSLGDVLAAEAMPPDVGVNVSDDVDVDQLLVETRFEAEASSVAELQGKVTLLESRVEDLEKRLREEIAQLVPAEAARIIREEIAALAAELDD